MTKAQFIQEGKMIDYVPSVAITGGDVIEIGSFVAVAQLDIPANVMGAVATRGVFDVVKTAVSEFTAGDSVYWDNDGDPAVGEAGSGAATGAATGNKYMGIAIANAALSDTTVRVMLRSIEDTLAETLSIGQLTDVGAVNYTAGRLLIADGDSLESRAVNGDMTLSGTGTATLNDAHAEQIAIIPVEDLAAGADISQRPIFVHLRYLTLVSIGILTQGGASGVNDSNPVTVLLEDDDSRTIVSKTFNSSTPVPSNDFSNLGTLERTSLNSEMPILLSVTQGATADMPAFSIILRFIPNNA